MWAAARGLCCPGAGVLLRRGCGEAALHRTRSLHGSAVSCGSKNLLKKFASKTRKKFWYEGPSLGFTGPSKLDLLLKRTSKRTRKEDHVRLRALNGLLYKALTDLLSTPEVSQEVYNLNVELSKVSLTPDFSACRVYWKVSLSADQNKRTEATLQRSAAHMRHLLMSQQTLRNVPPIVFIQDRKNAALAEIDGLLAVAEFGPPDEGDHPLGDDPSFQVVLPCHSIPHAVILSDSGGRNAFTRRPLSEHPRGSLEWLHSECVWPLDQLQLLRLGLEGLAPSPNLQVSPHGHPS
ncbi:ribosome binding factor A (putative), transcript variant X2 [Ictidomys tridecemlineatus]|nr:ribosome binding factor A (putative), transcript variant X2 [Ictidomys tridecemlineatus]